MTEPVRTTCMRCAVGCGHLHEGVDVGYGISTVRGDVAHPVNRGLACSRGVKESRDPEGEWLTRPLIRKEGELHPTTWDIALATVVERFQNVLERDPDGVAVLGSGQQTNEAAYMLGKLARGGFGTHHYDANTTLCMASAVTAYYDAFGSDAPPCTYEDIEGAQTHVIWGANPAVAHPVMFRWIAESADADNSRLIVVDPVETKTALQADDYIQLDAGTDLALARAVLTRAVERDTVDEEFIASATTGFDALRENLPDPADAAETAGVSLSTVDELVTAFTDPTLLYWGMGVNQSTQGTATARALIDLCLATGNLGPDSGPFSLTGQANSMGTRVCSSKGSWPGMRSFSDSAEREVIADAWGIPTDRLPDDAGPGPVGIVKAIDDGPVEAVWTVATNPAAGLPDATAARERLDEAFIVTQDAFRTETVELADVVLPAATWGESTGTTTNMERRVSRVRPVSDVPPGVRTDLEIVTTIGRRLVPGLLGDPDPEAVFTELAALTAGTPADLSGISYDRLDEESTVRWPASDAVSSGGYRYYEGGDWSFATSSGRACFSTARHDGVPEPPTEAYPLTLTTAREADGYNTGVRSHRPNVSDKLVARVAPTTLDDVALSLDGGRENGDEATKTAIIESRRATVTVCIEADDAIPEGVVWLPIHHPRTNDLTLPKTDPRSNEPNFKQCAVRVRPDTAKADRSAAWEVAADD